MPHTSGRHGGRQGLGVPAGFHGVQVIPPELWLLIFVCLDDKDLRTVTRTCSTFRILAQPLLFQVLDVCPFFLAYNADKPIYRPREYLHTTLQRLQFYKSPRIAPAVTDLWISPYARNGFPPRSTTDDLDPTLIISAIVDALPVFPNLRNLAWHCIDIRPSWWAVIHRQSNIQRLWVNSCSILPPSNLDSEIPSPHRPLKIAHLDLDQWAWDGHVTDHVSIHEEQLKGVGSMLLSMIINSESIRSVAVPRLDTAFRLLPVLGKLGSDTQYALSSLTIPYSSTMSEDFVPALIGTPSLKELRLLPPQETRIRNPELGDKLPHSSIPLLETYEGPYHLLPLFSNARHSEPRRLRFVDLWGLDDPIAMRVCDPNQLESVLEELSLSNVTLPALETIGLILTHVTIELMSILSRFSNLTEVHLDSQDSLIPNRRSSIHSSFELLPESSVLALYALLRSYVFSPSLQHLTITTRLRNPGHFDSTAPHVDAAKFLEGLARVNPRLETIDIRYGTYWTGIVDMSWRRRTYGVQDQESVDPEMTNSVSAESVSFLSTGGNMKVSPPVSRSSTASSLASIKSDSSQAAVERFFALPSKPRSTTANQLPLGDMTFSEQRRAGVLPEKHLPFQEAKVELPGFRWLVGGVNRFWYLVGSVRRIFVGGAGVFRD